MALFGKKNKKEGGSRRASDMSTILHESVPATALDIMRQNDAFIHLSDNDEEEYIGIVLDTEDIGGLDKKSKKDEAKGSIIECINSGRIATYLNAELMDAGCICIIPNASTLEALHEFSLLTNAPYEFCRVSDDGEVVLLGKKTTYNEVKDLIDRDGTINDILGDNSVGKAAPKVTNKEDDVAADISDDDDEIPTLDDDDEIAEAPDDVEVADDFDIPVVDDEDGISETGDDIVDDDDTDSIYEDAISADMMPEQLVEPEVMERALSRRFYSTDLGLEINPEAFDAQFMNGEGICPLFIEDRPSGIMNDQLNEKARQANLELKRIHRTNVWKTREMFFKMCAQAYETVRKNLDIEDSDTNYGQLAFDLKSEKARNINNIESRVAARRKEIDERWEKRLRERAMEAARAAQHDMKERYGKQHEDQLAEVERVERALIEDEFNDAWRNLLEQRRKEASVLYDMSVTEILEELSHRFSVYAAEEMDAYKAYKAEMDAFVDECRKDEANREAIAAEELRQSEKADKVLAEKKAELEAFANEQKVQRDKLVSELEEQRASYEDRIARMKGDADDERARLTKEIEDMQKRYDDLSLRYDNQEGIVGRRFEARIQELQDQRDALASAADATADAHARGGRMTVFITIIAVIAALAFGAILGGFFISKQYTNMQTQKIFDEYVQNNGRMPQQTEEQSEPQVEQQSEQW